MAEVKIFIMTLIKMWYLFAMFGLLMLFTWIIDTEEERY